MATWAVDVTYFMKDGPGNWIHCSTIIVVTTLPTNIIRYVNLELTIKC